jgi:hypothetical protein
MFNLTEKRHDFSLTNSLIDNFDISPNKNFSNNSKCFSYHLLSIY